MPASGSCMKTENDCGTLLFCKIKYSHPQLSAPMGMKKPLVNPATAAMTGERRNALTGKAQIREISRAIQVWFRQMLTTRT